MKKLFIILFFSLVGIAGAQTIPTLSPWYFSTTNNIITRQATNTVQIPSLASLGSPCLSITNTGILATTTCGGGGTPGGNNGDIQYNNNGVLEGDDNLNWTSSSQTFSINGSGKINGGTISVNGEGVSNFTNDVPYVITETDPIFSAWLPGQNPTSSLWQTVNTTSTVVDGPQVNTQIGGTSISTTVTTLFANEWVVGFGSVDGNPSWSPGTNTTQVDSHDVEYTPNPLVAPGNATIQITQALTGDYVLWGVPLEASGTIARDTFQDMVAGANSVTYPYTVTGSSPILLVTNIGDFGDDNTGVTYDGLPLTKIGSIQPASSDRFRSYWYLLHPPTGTHDIVVTGGAYIESTAVDYVNVAGVDLGNITTVTGVIYHYDLTKTPYLGIATTTPNMELVVNGSTTIIGSTYLPSLGTSGCLQLSGGGLVVSGSCSGGGGGTPGGNNGDIQYNNGGAFGGDAGLTYSSSTQILTVPIVVVPAQLLVQSTGSISNIDSVNRILSDSSGIPSLDYDTVRSLNDSSGNYSVIWGSRELTYGDNHTSVDWANDLLYSYSGAPSEVETLDWNLGVTYDNAGQTSIDWINRNLEKGAGSDILDWSTGNIGIDTSTPATELVVNGSTTIIGSTYLPSLGTSGCLQLSGGGLIVSGSCSGGSALSSTTPWTLGALVEASTSNSVTTISTSSLGLQPLISFPIPVASTSLSVQTPILQNGNVIAFGGSFSTSGTSGLQIASSSGNSWTFSLTTSSLGFNPLISFPIPVASTSLSAQAPLSINGNIIAFTGSFSTSGTSGLQIASSSGNSWTFSLTTSSLGFQPLISFPIPQASTTVPVIGSNYVSSTSCGTNLICYKNTGAITIDWNASVSTATITTATTTNLYFSVATGTQIDVSYVSSSVATTTGLWFTNATGTSVSSTEAYFSSATSTKTFALNYASSSLMLYASTTGGVFGTSTVVQQLLGADGILVNQATGTVTVYNGLSFSGNTSSGITMTSSSGAFVFSVTSSTWGLQPTISFPLPAASSTSLSFPLPSASSSAAGNTTQIEYNNATVRAGDSNLTWTSSTKNLSASTGTFTGAVITVATTTGLWFTNATGTRIDVSGETSSTGLYFLNATGTPGGLSTLWVNYVSSTVASSTGLWFVNATGTSIGLTFASTTNSSTTKATVNGALVGGVWFSAISANTVSNSAVSSTMWASAAAGTTSTIPSNTLHAGDQIVLTLTGVISTTGTIPTITETTVASSSAGQATICKARWTPNVAYSQNGFTLMQTIKVQTTGSTGTMLCGGLLTITSSTAPNSLNVISFSTTTAYTVSSTIPQTFVPLISFGTADVANTATTTDGDMEVKY